jgi:hypothetical protein
MTSIALVTLTQAEATLLAAITTGDTLAAIASAPATPNGLYARPTLAPRYYGGWSP